MCGQHWGQDPHPALCHPHQHQRSPGHWTCRSSREGCKGDYPNIASIFHKPFFLLARTFNISNKMSKKWQLMRLSHFQLTLQLLAIIWYHATTTQCLNIRRPRTRSACWLKIRSPHLFIVLVIFQRHWKDGVQDAKWILPTMGDLTYKRRNTVNYCSSLYWDVVIKDNVVKLIHTRWPQLQKYKCR